MKKVIKASLLAGITVIFFMILSSNCLSIISIPTSSSFLISDSDLVAKGEVKSKKEIGVIEFEYGEYKRVLALFRIDRVIKGEEIANAGDEINIELFESETGRVRFEELSKGEYCIVFLKREAGNFQFHERISYSKIPALHEKAKVVLSKDTPIYRMAEELLNNLSDKDYEIARYAIDDLGTLGIKEVIPYLKELEGAEDSAIKGESFAARIKLGDFSCINKAVKYVEQVPDTRETKRAKWGIEEAIENIRDVKVVSLLNVLSEHPYEEIRESAVRALEGISDPSSMPYFAKRLHDSNSSIRAIARAGMEKITGKNMVFPELDDFDKNEEQHIKRWEEWWREEGKAMYLKK